MKKGCTPAAVLTALALLISGCASFQTGPAGPSAAPGSAATTESLTDSGDAEVTIDLGDHPDWLLLPPVDEGYFFGIGVNENLLKAKQLSILNAGQQFSTRITSFLEERAVAENGKTETMITTIDKQVTDQVVYGAKFIDQYEDPQGRHWVLSRAPLNCMLDAAEGVLLSYRLDVGQEEETIKAVIDAVEDEVKEIEVYFKNEGALSVTAVSNGKLYVDGELLHDVTGGAGAIDITLDTGTHEVELRYGNGEREKKNVFIMKDLATKIAFRYDNPVPEGFVLLEAGTFTMGSPASEANRNSNETRHTVRISRDFYISKYEVTQAEWTAVMENNPGKFSGDNLPVEQVSWYEAVEYCNKRSGREGLTPAYTINGENVTWNKNTNGYRLPTEASGNTPPGAGRRRAGTMYTPEAIVSEAWRGTTATPGTRLIRWAGSRQTSWEYTT